MPCACCRSTSEEEENRSLCKKITCTSLLVLGVILLVVLVLALHVVLMLTLFFSSGEFYTTAGWVGILTFSYIILFSLSVLCWFLCCCRRRNRGKSTAVSNPGESENPRKKKFWIKLGVIFLGGYIIMFLFSELALGILNPTVSIFPLESFSADAFQNSSYKPAGCDVASSFNPAKAFYENSTIDFSDVRVVYGGIPLHFGGADAQVIYNVIHLTGNICPSENLLVHEISHIWQFQEKIWFSPFGYSFWEWMIGQAICRSCPYDYGGFDGLDEANETAKVMVDFGFEQQASIVEDYHSRIQSGSTSGATFQLLQKYSNEILLSKFFD